MSELRLHRLRRWEFGQILHIGRSEAPTPSELEIEQVFFGGIAPTHLGDPESAVLAVHLGGRQVGVVLHYPHERLPGVQYLAAVFLEPSSRGLGLGRQLMELATNDARERSGRAYVMWVVHPDNAAMLRISETVGEALGVAAFSGYAQFVQP